VLGTPTRVTVRAAGRSSKSTIRSWRPTLDIVRFICTRLMAGIGSLLVVCPEQPANAVRGRSHESTATASYSHRNCEVRSRRSLSWAAPARTPALSNIQLTRCQCLAHDRVLVFEQSCLTSTATRACPNTSLVCPPGRRRPIGSSASFRVSQRSFSLISCRSDTGSTPTARPVARVRDGAKFINAFRRFRENELENAEDEGRVSHRRCLMEEGGVPRHRDKSASGSVRRGSLRDHGHRTGRSRPG
jgi:hypothetical protein